MPAGGPIPSSARLALVTAAAEGPDEAPRAIATRDTAKAARKQELEEMALAQALELGVPEAGWAWFMELLKPLADHNLDTYLHCLRVGISASGLAAAVDEGGVQPTLALHGGTAHDVGKLGIPNSVLLANPFGAAQRRIITRHAVAGFLRLRGASYEAALIAGLHHAFQQDPYGLEVTEDVANEVVLTAKLVSMCDFFDALMTRHDGRFAEDQRNVAGALKLLEEHFPESTTWASWLTSHPLAA